MAKTCRASASTVLGQTWTDLGSGGGGKFGFGTYSLPHLPLVRAVPAWPWRSAISCSQLQLNLSARFCSLLWLRPPQLLEIEAVALTESHLFLSIRICCIILYPSVHNILYRYGCDLLRLLYGAPVHRIQKFFAGKATQKHSCTREIAPPLFLRDV